MSRDFDSKEAKESLYNEIKQIYNPQQLQRVKEQVEHHVDALKKKQGPTSNPPLKQDPSLPMRMQPAFYLALAASLLLGIGLGFLIPLASPHFLYHAQIPPQDPKQKVQHYYHQYLQKQPTLSKQEKTKLEQKLQALIEETKHPETTKENDFLQQRPPENPEDQDLELNPEQEQLPKQAPAGNKESHKGKPLNPQGEN